MKRIVICIASLYFLFDMIASSQGSILDLQVGTGTYSMRDLKGFNRYIKNNIPFDTKVVADFPPFLNYSVTLKFRIKNGYLGFIQTIQTTGSRISGRDYSGEYVFDISLTGYSPGFYSEFKINTVRKAELSFYSALGAVFTGMKMHERFVVLEEEINDDRYGFRAQSLFLEPGLKVSHQAGRMNFAFNAGYLVQFGNGSFGSAENKLNKLGNPDTGDVVRPGWNGFRAGISVSFRLRSGKGDQKSS